ncbi:MAG: hypothetical protein NDI61_13610 [Bdellovibrionaceae bacterium]|nr:hypothetical protein [Pseudobdellovibrionaceae bacterium]
MQRLRKRRANCKNESGQAIIEYILILVVVIALILGLAYQFNSAFRVYVTNYFGNYLACLIETGELPILGANSGGGSCHAQFYRPFNPADGQPLPGFAGSGGGGGGGGGGSRPGSSGSSGQTSAKGNRSSDRSNSASSRSGNNNGSGGGAADSGNGGNGSARTAASLINGRGRPKQTQVGQLAGNSNEAPKALELAKRRSNSVGEVDPNQGRVNRMSLDRRFFSDRELEARGKEKPIMTLVNEAESGSTLRPKVTSFEARRKVAAKEDDNEESIGIGGILRILLIIAIVVILFLLIGGQALQISKSWEK